MKLAAQLYNVRDYTKTPEAIEATLRRVKAIGFDVIQISGFGPCDVDLLAGWIKELGLEVCVTHVPWARLADPGELALVIAEHKKIGCGQVGLGMRPGDVYPSSYEGWTRFIKKMNGIIAQVQDAGLVFSYHNHELEFEKWQGETAFDRLIRECPHLDFVLDTFWVQAGGANPVTCIKKLKGRIRTIHFKDFRVRDRTRQFAEIGQGNIEWDEIIPLCLAQQIPYAAIEQDADFLVDPFESLAQSLAFLKGKLPA
ncbi:MAG: sugar phosphate isomerase/epimerase [Treponema sp.]|jgi:sugar phosphate isomerase/epimerase|nr:sugar phosphate isomerase/epimerase [Treponema sp.]